MPRDHPRLLRHPLALAQVTRRAGGDDAVPCGLAALAARDHMIEGEIILGRAILAFEAIAQEHVEPGEGGIARRPDEGFQRYHGRQLHFERRMRTTRS